MKILYKFKLLLLAVIVSNASSCRTFMSSNVARMDIKRGDTIYIEKVQNLKGGIIRLPESCTIIIKEGYFKNGVVELNGAKIVADDYKLVFHSSVSVYSKTKISYCTPFWFAAVGDGKWDDTESINKCVKISKDINLCGKSFVCSTINLTSETNIHDGSIHGSKKGPIFTASGVCGIKLHHVNVDGGNIAQMGIYLKASKAVNFDCCMFKNFDGGYKQATGIFLHTTDGIVITNSSVSHVLSRPNGKIGDGDGSSTGILLELCDNVLISRNKIYDLPNPEDADGIHCNTGVDNKTVFNILISDNEIFDCSKRCIKIQQRGVTIKDNYLYSSSYSAQINSAISIYSSDCSVDNNHIDVSTPYPIIIDTDWEHKNITIINNIIHDMGKSYQGTITVLAEIDDLKIENNSLTIDDKHQSAVYLRNNCSNVGIIGNVVEGGLNFVWIRAERKEDQVDNLIIKNNRTNNTSIFVNNTGSIERIKRIELKDNRVKGLNVELIPQESIHNKLSRGINLKR